MGIKLFIEKIILYQKNNKINLKSEFWKNRIKE